MGALMRSTDWAATPLGSLKSWLQSLRTSLSICLSSRFPILLMWGTDLVMLYNDAYRPILGVTKHPSALGRPAQEVWPEIWDIVGPMLTSVLNQSEATWSEDQLLPLNRNGFLEECYFTFSYSPIRDETGGVGGICCTVSETTKRVLGERRLGMLKALSESTSGSKTVEEACINATVVLTNNPKDLPFALVYILEAEGRSARLVGTASDFVAPERVEINDPEAAWPFAHLGTGESTGVLVDDLETRFGIVSPSWPQLIQCAYVLPISRIGGDAPLGFLVAGISPRLFFDADYRSFLELVAGAVARAMVDARTLEDERRRAETLAELDQAKTVFFSNASHELRTPLTLILGPLEEILTAPENPIAVGDKTKLQMIQRNSLRLLKLVNTLLDFSRIEAGRLQASYAPTDLAIFTNDLASVFRSGIEQAGLRLVVDCPPLPQLVYVDREMWEKILINLLSNALKFTFSGEITVSLRCSGEVASLSVRDTGIGIAEHHFPRLFERFYRVEGARGRTHEGSGIGLSLVSELVKLHGGNITVSSVLDVGSVFTVTVRLGTSHLPANKLVALDTVTPATLNETSYLAESLHWLPNERSFLRSAELDWPEEATKSQVSPVHRARILIAEDNADMREYLLSLLDERYAVEMVANGEEAINAIERKLPDLVIADVMMPCLDGFGLLRFVRARPGGAKLPVILLSARAGEEARIEGLNAGADDYMVKPFSARELLARVETRLEMARLRNQADEQLQQAMERTRLANEVARLGTWQYELQTKICSLDARMYEICGFPTDTKSLSFEQLIQRIHPEDYPRMMDARRSALAPDSSGRYDIEYRVIWPDGSEHWLFVNGQALFDGEGIERRAVAFFGTALDISERKYLEQEREGLLERERLNAQRLSGLAEAALTISSASSVQQVLKLVTDQARLLVGAHQSVTSVTFNQNWAEAISAFSLSDEYVDRHNYDAPANGLDIYSHVGKQNRSIRLTQAELEAHPIWRAFTSERPPMGGWVAVPLVGRDGCNIGLIQLSDKYTGEFTAEDEAVLVQLAQLATAAIENARLIEAEQQARTVAETANRIKDEFLAVLSHELRAPLNPILGWAQLLQIRKFDQTKTAEALSIIERSARLQAQLIDDLLDIAKILRGKLTMESEPVNLVDVIRSALDTVKSAAHAKSIQIQSELPEVALVVGDSGRLQQVVWNLLSNAVKFSPNFGQVKIRLERVDNQAQITVSDNGKGIAPDFLPYIFESFRQEDASTTRKYGGLGLGLAIVRTLVDAHGGTISAESEGEAKGATFTIRLPWLKTQTQIQEQPKYLAEPELQLTGVRVLIVDDDFDNRELLTVMLVQYGMEVMSVESAAAAFACLDAFAPDVLVSDIGMPEMDGYHFLQTLRSMPIEKGGQVPAIALTAYAREQDIKLALESGFQRHVNKPIQLEQFVQAVEALASTRTSQRARQ